MGEYWLKIVCVLSILVATANAKEIVNPEQHFLADRPQEKNCLWRIQADLNADLQTEQLLSLESYRNGKAEHIWQVYLGTGGGFKVASELISFRTDAVFIGHIREIDAPGILAYFPGKRFARRTAIVPG